MIERVLLEILFFLIFLTALLVVAPRRFWPILLCAYLIRAALCFVHSYAWVLPDSQFDAIRFESTAWLWAQDARCLDDFTTGSLLYSWIGSCVYVAAGRTAVLLQLINSFLGTAIVLVAMHTTQILTPHGTSYRLVGWLLALHPTMLLYSAITMREVAVVLPFVLSMYCLVKWRVYKMYRYGASSIFWIMLSQMFHTGMIVGTMLVVSIVIYYTVADHWRRIARVRVALRDVNAVAGSVFVFALLVLAASIMSGTGHGLDKIQRLATEGVLEALSGWQIQVARGRASYLNELQPSGLVDLVLQAPLRMLYFVTAPFAWTISKARDVWGLVDGSFLFVLLLLIVRDLAYSRLRGSEFRIIRIIGVIAIIMMMGFAMVTSNYGTAFRHRAKFVPVLIVVYAYGSSMRRNRRDIQDSDYERSLQAT